jgi:hypothetical protein
MAMLGSGPTAMNKVQREIYVGGLPQNIGLTANQVGAEGAEV